MVPPGPFYECSDTLAWRSIVFRWQSGSGGDAGDGRGRPPPRERGAAARPVAGYLVKYQYSGVKVYSGLNCTLCSVVDTASTP